MPKFYGFEWVNHYDRQLHYNSDKFENEYIPLNPSHGQGFEWLKDDDEQQQYRVELKDIKTLILSDGEYKRLDESIHFKENVSAVPTMTRNTKPKGEVSASTSSNINFPPWKVFGDGEYNYPYWRVQGDTVEDRHWVQYKFEENIAISKLSLTTNSFSGDPDNYGIKNFELLGSRDGENFTTLYKNIHPNNGKTKGYPFINKEKYMYYRLKLDSYRGKEDVSVQRFEMFEFRESPKWHTVSTTTPTVEQFKNESMVDIGMLDRREQVALDSPIAMTEATFGEGKLFSSKVDLKRIIDLRRLEVAHNSQVSNDL